MAAGRKGVRITSREKKSPFQESFFSRVFLWLEAAGRGAATNF